MDPSEELFDIEFDPYEMRNLLAVDHPHPALEKMRAYYQQWLDAWSQQAVSTTTIRSLRRCLIAIFPGVKAIGTPQGISLNLAGAPSSLSRRWILAKPLYPPNIQTCRFGLFLSMLDRRVGISPARTER